MKTFFSPLQLLHQGAQEFTDGQWMQCVEHSGRAEIIVSEISARQLGEVLMPDDWGLAPILRVHSTAYVEFLQNAWAQWQGSGRRGDMLPSVWCGRHLRQDRVPESLDGKLGYFSFDSGTPIMAGTWQAIYASAQSAVAGADRLRQGESGAFSLCRPPGHHASADQYGGYCFLNNAAIAAQYLVDGGCARVAVLDIDYHHGNGTQSIFYPRGDVLVASLHAHPAVDYPYFLGYEDETGEGPGKGFNLNLPLPLGTDWSSYRTALHKALAAIDTFAADALIVSLGCDTYHADPISQFMLSPDDFIRIGESIATVRTPTLFVLEGGYATDALGVNVANVLTGFLGHG